MQALYDAFSLIAYSRDCSACFASDSTSAAQVSIRSIQKAGLLTMILNHLECLEDIVCCSAVSKSWKIATQLVRLVVPGINPKMDEAGMMAVLHWVVSKQQRQELKV